MSKDVNPYRRALWTIKRLYEAIEGFLFENYITQTHNALGVSPATALKESVEAHGTRGARLIEYNEEFLALSLIEDSQLTRKIIAGKGVKFMKRLYSQKLLNDPRWVGKIVPVRYDPMDDSYVAVSLGGEWVLARCRCQEDKYHGEFSREEISAARSFLFKTRDEMVGHHQQTQSLVDDAEASLKEETEQDDSETITKTKPVTGLFNKKMDPSNHKPESF